MTLDFTAFDSLYGSCERLRAEHTIDTARLVNHANNASTKELEKWLKPFRDLLKKPDDQEAGINEAIKDLGGGF